MAGIVHPFEAETKINVAIGMLLKLEQMLQEQIKLQQSSQRSFDTVAMLSRQLNRVSLAIITLKGGAL